MPRMPLKIRVTEKGETMDIRTSLVWQMLNLKYQLINQVNLSQRQQMCISVCVCVYVCISKVRERDI